MMLDGVRVLDLSQYLSGPSATRLLAAFGADVIKVEFGPDGDPARLLPVIDGPRSAYYVQQNRGKRCIAVDLSRSEGHDLVRDLAAECDVFVENFGPGVLERRGLDYTSIAAVNPAIVYASISAFGRSGVMSHLPGYDLMGQAVSGMMHITGDPDGPPQFTGSPIGDCAAGLVLWGAIGHALFHRDRTGEGQHIESTLVDALFHMHSIAVQAPSVTGGEFRQGRTGRQFGMVVPSGTYRGPEGWIVIQVLDRQWSRFCAAMDRPDLEADPRFATAAGRTAHGSELIALVEEWTTSFVDDAGLLAHLEAHRVPAAPVLDPADAATHPYFTERDMVRTVHDPLLGDVTVPGVPVRTTARSEPDIEPAAPFLGQHNRAVLSELLGYDDGRIDDLEAAGVLCSEPVPD